MTRIFRHYHALGKVEDNQNLEDKSSEGVHTLFRTSSLLELCSYINNCPVKSCKPNCRIEVFYNKYGVNYL